MEAQKRKGGEKKKKFFCEEHSSHRISEFHIKDYSSSESRAL